MNACFFKQCAMSLGPLVPTDLWNPLLVIYQSVCLAGNGKGFGPLWHIIIFL